MVNSVRFLFPSPNPVGHPMPPRWTPGGIPPNGSVVLFPMPTTGFITFPSVGFTLQKFPPQVLGYGPRPMVGSGPVRSFPPFLSEYEQQLDLSHPHRIRKILLRLFIRILRVVFDHTTPTVSSCTKISRI